ncbi:hypothetical protein KC723_02195 [Candidatus Kaiserbacteria bacterium]|nr:hypothetical protein [Candidatus Kaiserbacteria bacterium]
MRLFLYITVIIITFSIINFPKTSLASNERKLPQDLQQCFDDKISKLLAIDKLNINQVRNLFYQTIERNWLGSRAYGGATWKNWSKEPKIQQLALAMYFNLIYTRGISSTANLNNPTVKARLPDTPYRYENQGIYKVIVSIFSRDKPQVFLVITTINCQVIDFGMGDIWASSLIDPATVENKIIELKQKGQW